MAFLHQHSSEDSTFLQNEAIEGRDVHAFDCFNVISSTDILQLKFFVPLILAYRVTIAMVHRTKLLNCLTTVVSAELKDIQTPWTKSPLSLTQFFLERSLHISVMVINLKLRCTFPK